MSLLNISEEAQDALLNIGSRDAQKDVADLVALLRAELQPGGVVARAALSILDRIEGLATAEEHLAWRRQGDAEWAAAMVQGGGA